MNSVVEFSKGKHVKFFKRCLDVLPGRYGSSDTMRMTIAFFAISGLDMLDSLSIIDGQKNEIIEWIYSLQVLPGPSGNHNGRAGFQGSSSSGLRFKRTEKISSEDEIPSYVCGHLAMTYTALASLLILGDDLGRVNSKAIVESIKQLQLPDGSFQPSADGGENDMRFLYCASCICYILHDWSGINIPKAVDYVIRSQSYEGGIGQGPGLEAHGGSSFCSIASLCLMGELDSAFTTKQLHNFKHWLKMRQNFGFQGRPNKPEDSCYSFWVGSSLQILSAYNQIDKESIRLFTLSTQNTMVGGFSKWPNCSPDLMHTYLSIVGLSLLEVEGISSVHPALNFSQRAVNHLHTIFNSDQHGS